MRGSDVCWAHSFGRLRGVPWWKNSTFHLVLAVASIGVTLVLFVVGPSRGTQEDIHKIVTNVDENVQQLQTDVAAMQAGSTTRVQVTARPLFEVRRDHIPTELEPDFRAGRVFYERHLHRSFPELPERFFVQLLLIRATPREARAVHLRVVAERGLLAVFSAYKGYGSVRHARNYEPPQYNFGVAPLLSQKMLKIYLLDERPFARPTVEAHEWVR